MRLRRETFITVLRMCLPLLALAAVGCQALPKLHKAPPSHAVVPVRNPAFTPTGDVPRGKATGPSGVASLENGPEAFAVRVAMARFARQSLDMQYYIWDGDQTGTYLLAEVLDAADRGVKVRLMLDDNPAKGLVEGLVNKLAEGGRALAAEMEDDLAEVTPEAMQRRDRIRKLMDEVRSGGRDLVAAALDTHPNIEVRMFNPNTVRGGGIGRLAQWISHFSRLNRRMHNKIYAADNQMAIVGGRNIADIYYGMHPEHNWRDLDLLVRGPVVQEVSDSFDLYWNSEWAVPVSAFTWKSRSGRRLADLRVELDEYFVRAKDDRLRSLDSDATVAAKLGGATSRMVQAQASVIADTPTRFDGSSEAVVADALAREADASHKEILVETAYFVPEKRTFERMEQRVSEGVAVCTLTNSLGSTNQPTVHAGYIRHRKDLLRSGVQMYELKPSKGEAAESFGFLVRDSRAGIHTKAVVFDRRRVFVGTFNLDPRSVELNTEIGLMVDSPALSEQVAKYIRQGMEPEWSWKVQLGRPGEEGRGGRRLCWSTGDPEHPEILVREPDTSFLRRLSLRLMSWLPIQGLL